MSARESFAVPPSQEDRIRGGMTMAAAMDAPAASRPGTAGCGFCGQALFGEVAFCPYCGHATAGASAATGADAARAAPRTNAAAPAHEAVAQAASPTVPAQAPRDASTPADDVRAARKLADSVQSYGGTPRLFDHPDGARAAPAGKHWMTRWMAILVSATALALAGIAVQDFAERASGRARPPAARPAPPAGATAPAPAPDTRLAGARGTPAPSPSAAAAGTGIAPAGPSPRPSASMAPATPAQPPRAETVAPRADRGQQAQQQQQQQLQQQPQPQGRAAEPPAPRRSLCSAANEASGLCKPQ